MKACVSMACVDAAVIAELAIRWDKKSPHKTMTYMPNVRAPATHQRKNERTFQHHSRGLKVQAKNPAVAVFHERMSNCI
jgi:hypothetical protein